MTYTPVDWQSIEKQGKGLVEIHGVLVGAIIEDLGKGIQMSLGPHPTKSGLAPLVDNFDMRVQVVVPFDFISSQRVIELQYAQELGNPVEVEGEYTPKRDGDYVGEIVAKNVLLHL